MSTDDLRDLIDEKITTNGEQEITGAILNNVLKETVNTLADGENLDEGSIKTANIADGAITTDKIADGNVKTGKIEDHAVTKDKLDQNVSSDLDWAVASNSYYRNSQAGDVAAKVITTYKNINLIGGGSLKVTFEQANTADDATLNIDGKGAKPLYYNGARVSSTNSWEAGETVEIYYNNYTTGIYYAKRWMVKPVSVSQNTLRIGGNYVGEMSTTYDVTLHSGQTFASLSALLSDANLNTLIPLVVRKGGMSIKFVCSSDNNYVQFRCIADEFTTNLNYWESMVISDLLFSNNPKINSIIKELYIPSNAGFTNSDVGKIRIVQTSSGSAQLILQKADGSELVYENILQGVPNGVYKVGKIYIYTDNWPSSTYDSGFVNVQLKSQCGSILGNPIINNYLQDIDINEIKKSCISNSFVINGIIKELYILPNAGFTYSDVASIRLLKNSSGYCQIIIRNANDANLIYENLTQGNAYGLYLLDNKVYIYVDNYPTSTFDTLYAPCSLNGCCASLESNPRINAVLSNTANNKQYSIGDLLSLPINRTGSGGDNGNTLFKFGKTAKGLITITGSSTSLYAFFIQCKCASGVYQIWQSGNLPAGTINLSIDLWSAIGGNSHINDADFEYLYITYNRYHTGTLIISDVKVTDNISPFVMIDNINANQSTSIWKGKTIAWYGTSIPAGNAKNIPFDGLPVAAQLSYNDAEIITSRTTCPNQYPVMVGSLVGAKKVYNEALGSSSAAKPTTGNDLLNRCKGLANTVIDICDLLTGCYNIDWSNHTFTRNTDNSYGITSFLPDSDWATLMSQFGRCVKMSYQISIVSRYLISDSNEHDSYIQTIFGDYYSNFSSNIDLATICGYREDIDLFVIDHGTNDSSFASTGQSRFIVESSDTTKFEGAINLFIEQILLYKSSARIIVISNYDQWKLWIDGIGLQKAMAERWQLPFADVSKILPLPERKIVDGTTTPAITDEPMVYTRGYWDSGQHWHDEGFTWSEDGDSYTTNNAIFTGSKSSIISNFAPTQINGHWAWKSNPKRFWLYDNLHPHSDADGRINKEYAKYLASFINGMGNTF